MQTALKQLAGKTLRKFNIAAMKYSTYLRVQPTDEIVKSRNLVELFRTHPDGGDDEIATVLRRSQSQYGQDLFVLYECGFKRDGYFVEFGATNGIGLSNSNLLEKEYGWKGIVAEPARGWHKALKENRSCHIETDCVWSRSGAELSFHEVEDGELSTLDSYSGSDKHQHNRVTGERYTVRTISLLDLLEKYEAPRVIDYLSIDTEGSEFDILSAFDFGRYRFRVITCEHNHTPQREKIFDLLTSVGYIRCNEQLSYVDDWYIHPGQD